MNNLMNIQCSGAADELVDAVRALQAAGFAARIDTNPGFNDDPPAAWIAIEAAVDAGADGDGGAAVLAGIAEVLRQSGPSFRNRSHGIQIGSPLDYRRVVDADGNDLGVGFWARTAEDVDAQLDMIANHLGAPRDLIFATATPGPPQI